MTGSAPIRLLSVLARLVGFAGAVFSVGFAAWWMFSWFDALPSSSSPERWNVGIVPLAMVLQILIAAWVVWSVIKASRRFLLLVLPVAFVGSFVVSYGWYFLLLGEGLEFIGAGNLLYLFAALFMVGARLASVADDQARNRT